MLEIKITIKEQVNEPKFKIGDMVRLQNIYAYNANVIAEDNGLDVDELINIKQDKTVGKIVKISYVPSEDTWLYFVSFGRQLSVHRFLKLKEKQITSLHIPLRNIWEYKESIKNDGYYDLFVKGKCSVRIYSKEELEWLYEYLQSRKFFDWSEGYKNKTFEYFESIIKQTDYLDFYIKKYRQLKTVDRNNIDDNLPVILLNINQLILESSR